MTRTPKIVLVMIKAYVMHLRAVVLSPKDTTKSRSLGFGFRLQSLELRVQGL